VEMNISQLSEVEVVIGKVRRQVLKHANRSAQVGQTLGILHFWMLVALRYTTKMIVYSMMKRDDGSSAAGTVSRLHCS
jgi:hypothetical protein